MEHLCVISHDIADDRRWRQVFRIMNGFGEWLQFSVFQCRLDRMRVVQLQTELNDAIHHQEELGLILDLGPTEGVRPHVISLGKRFEGSSVRPWSSGCRAASGTVAVFFLDPLADRNVH